MATTFQTVDRATPYILPQSIEDWLPEDHLARFVVEIVGKLDLGPLRASYAGRGSMPCDPGMLLALLFYGYATGVRSSRKIEAATYDSIAFRYISANSHSDHDTIAFFRLTFLERIPEYFVRILEAAREMGLKKVGSVSLDGTKVKANAGYCEERGITPDCGQMFRSCCGQLDGAHEGQVENGAFVSGRREIRSRWRL